MVNKRKRIGNEVKHVVRYYTNWGAVVGAVFFVTVIYFAVSFMSVGLFLMYMIAMGSVIDGVVVIGTIFITSFICSVITVKLCISIVNENCPKRRFMLKEKVEHRGL